MIVGFTAISAYHHLCYEFEKIIMMHGTFLKFDRKIEEEEKRCKILTPNTHICDYSLS
jgi:hypothetical protein